LNNIILFIPLYYTGQKTIFNKKTLSRQHILKLDVN